LSASFERGETPPLSRQGELGRTYVE